MKSAATVSTSDFPGLRKLKEAVRKRITGEVVLYDGETCASFGNGMHAVPIRALWENSRELPSTGPSSIREPWNARLVRDDRFERVQTHQVLLISW